MLGKKNVVKYQTMCDRPTGYDIITPYAHRRRKEIGFILSQVGHTHNGSSLTASAAEDSWSRNERTLIMTDWDTVFNKSDFSSD